MPKLRSRPPQEGIHEPNMTPLIDVSLVLVVILMVATPLAFQSGIAVQAAARGGSAAAKEAHAERIELSLKMGGLVTVNRVTVPRDSLASVLRPLLAASPTGTVVVQCEDGVPHGQFVGVLDEARRLGAAHLAVVGS
jgi:biopolymer transport protein ExbD